MRTILLYFSIIELNSSKPSFFCLYFFPSADGSQNYPSFQVLADGQHHK